MNNVPELLDLSYLKWYLPLSAGAAMVSVMFPSLPQALMYLGSLYCIYHVYWELTIGGPRRRLSNKKGCKKVKKRPATDPIFGLDFIWQNYKELKRHTVLEWYQRLHERPNFGTFQLRVLSEPLIFTTEPENLKTMLSVDFKLWSVGQPRKTTLTPFLGEGIFTSDGAAWQHSRNLLRPIFNRRQIGNIDMQDRHVCHLIQALPRDGSTIDLQGLFFSLTLDIATEFLFGQSTNSLAPDENLSNAEGFAEAFSYCQSALSGEGDIGFWVILFSDRKFKRKCKFIHGELNAKYLKMSRSWTLWVNTTSGSLLL